MFYINCKLVLENEIIENAYIEIENKVIKSFGKMNSNIEGIDLKGLILMPGFIDGHIHGSLGCDFMNNSKESINKILSYLPIEGVTSVLATTMTATPLKLQNVVQTINNYQVTSNECKIAGVHLEGPFINKSKKGAQNSKDILALSIDDFEVIRNNTDIIKVVTYAPEHDDDFKFTNHLLKLGIRGSIGHSNAKTDCCNKCFDQGVSRVTHLYNAMSGFHHRDGGVVVSAFLNKMLCELIVDKIHVASDVVAATFKILGASNIALITDSMNAKGLDDGVFTFGGQEVTVKDNKALLSDGTLAGSLLKYNEGVKNMVEITNCTLSELSMLTSINQSKDLELNTGQIKKGFAADFVVLDNDLNIEKTIIDGQIVYEKETI